MALKSKEKVVYIFEEYKYIAMVFWAVCNPMLVLMRIVPLGPLHHLEKSVVPAP
jgi:hypothetical protein